MADVTYTLHYLGCSTLSKGTTGLGLIQKPLKEHYFNFHKKVTKSPVEVYMKVTHSGLDILTPTGSTSGTYLKNTHYEFNMINYMEAVQFTVNKNNTRKTQYAFMPLDEKRTIKSPAKLFSTLEKKNNYLLKITHQPIVVCLLRRQAGLKALDCHVFLSLSMTDAGKIVDSFNHMQQQSMRSEYIGDFGSAAAAASQNVYPPPKDPRTNEATNYRSHPATTTENLAVGSYNAMAPGGEYPPYNPEERYQLRDDYFRQQVRNDWSPPAGNDIQNQRQYGQPQPYNQQPPHQNTQVPLTRGSSFHDKASAHHQQGQGFPPNYSRSANDNLRDYGRPSSYDERQRLGQAGEPNPMTTQRTNESDSYSSNMSHPQNYQPNSFPPNQLSPSGPMFSLSNLESRQQFDRRNNTGPTFEAAHNKPIAKVPPHKIAGVKVLPTAFQLPKRPLSPQQSFRESDNGAKLSSDQSGWEKPDVQYRHSSADNQTTNNQTANNRYSNVYAFDSKSHESNGNYLRSSLSPNEQPRPMSMAAANDYYKNQIPSMSQNDIYRQYQNSHFPPQHLHPHYQLAAGGRQQFKADNSSAGQDRRSQAPPNNDDDDDAMRRQQYNHNYKQLAASNPQLNVSNKDAEIASMFQNMGIDRQQIQPAYYRQQDDNMNFEKALGYYP